MLWGAISFYGVSELVFLSEGQEYKTYAETLENFLLPCAAEVFGEQTTWTFQHDNAPIHKSRYTRSWMI